MFVTSEGLNTKIHVKSNTLITQCKCYRRTHVSVELTRQVGVGTRYYIKCQYDVWMVKLGVTRSKGYSLTLQYVNPTPEGVIW